MIDRTLAPRFYSPEFRQFPLPSKSRLTNGLNIYSFNNGDQEVFKIDLIFSGGSSTTKNPALPTLCTSMLREGSKTKSSKEINNALDYYGAFLDIKAGIDNTTVTLYGRSIFIKELLPLLAEIVLSPTFEEGAIDKHRKKMTQNLLISQEKTSYWAPRLLRRSIFGENHPYSNFLNPNGIKSISRDDLIQYHEEKIKSGLQQIFISGSYNEVDVNSLLENQFGTYTVGKKNHQENIPVSNLDKSIIKELTDTSQSSIAIGMSSLAIKDKKYPHYAYLTKVLGGYFGSRLMKKLREEEGLTYGIHAYNVHLHLGSYLQISSDIELKSVDRGIDLIDDEISKLRHEAISVEEANTVKNYMIGEFVNDSNTVFDFSDLYKHLVLHELEDNYYQLFYDSISTVEPKMVQELASQLLEPDNFSVVKVI